MNLTIPLGRTVLLVVGLLATLILFSAQPTPAQAGCPKSAEPVRSISKKNARKAIGCLFNKGRSAPNVKRRGDLKRAAQNHSAVMASKKCFSHQCSGEPNLKERVARTGYLRGTSNYGLGEVILYNRTKITSREIVRKWMDSPPHRSTITKSSFDHVGIGLAMRDGLVFATADFGYR